MTQLLKKKLFLLMAVTVMILVFAGIFMKDGVQENYLGNAVSVAVSPFQRFISFCDKKISTGLFYLSDVGTVREENKVLRLKIDELEKQNVELQGYKEKNEELRRALNIKDQFGSYNVFGANIIGKDVGNWFCVFTIDRGIQDGVNSQLPVVTSKGLVGRIIESSTFSSKVLSIIDENSTVSARLSKTRDLVVVRGDITLKNEGLCRMEYISTDVDVLPGDIVETSGIGETFPKGVIIGKVRQVLRRSSDLNRYALIEPSVDFKRIEEVIVLKGNQNK